MSYDSSSNRALQEQITAFIRAFGLHRPEQTPCGEPVSVAEAHALMELRLTAAGQQAAAQLAIARQAKFARLLSAIPESQHPAILEALRLLTEALND